MPKTLSRIVKVAVFAVPMVVFSAALANSTHGPREVTNADRDRYARCMQTLHESEFCAARVAMRSTWIANGESDACRYARRNIVRYDVALGHLEAARALHRPAVAIYRQARGAETAWYRQHC